MTVTRTELAAHVAAAFSAGPASRDGLLAYAVGSHARPAVIMMINSLPDKSYPSLRDLWYHLGELPVGQ